MQKSVPAGSDFKGMPVERKGGKPRSEPTSESVTVCTGILPKTSCIEPVVKVVRYFPILQMFMSKMSKSSHENLCNLICVTHYRLRRTRITGAD